MTNKTGRRARTTALSCAAALTLLIVVVGCTRPGSSTGGRQSYVQQVNAQGTSHWTCTSKGLGGHMHGENLAQAGYSNPAYQGQTKGTLSLADCRANAATFDRVLQFALRYPTKQSASAFAEAVQFVPGLGTHHMTGSMGGPNVNPFFLQYDGDTPDAPLAGMSWFTYSGNNPPAGFAGGNDFWHSHVSLCYTTRDKIRETAPGAPGIGVAANEVSDAECAALGGFNLKLPGIWMSHAWIVPGYEDRFDVFASASPCVMGKGKPAANDPCHDKEMDHDPEAPGLPPTTARPGTPTTRSTSPTTRRPGLTTTMPPMDHGGMDHSH